MPKRVPAIPDDILRREVGHLADDVLLLPIQVTLLTGLSVGQLKERLRTRPPQPPHPEPRERPKEALWYSLGEVRRFRAHRVERAAMNAELAKLGFRAGFAMWLNTGTVQSDPWPFALVGPHKRPVDVWGTIRGEVAMGRGDRISWLTLPEYLEARQKAAEAQQRAEDHVEAVGTAEKRQERGGTVMGLPTNRVRPKA